MPGLDTVENILMISLACLSQFSFCKDLVTWRRAIVAKEIRLYRLADEDCKSHERPLLCKDLSIPTGFVQLEQEFDALLTVASVDQHAFKLISLLAGIRA